MSCPDTFTGCGSWAIHLAGSVTPRSTSLASHSTMTGARYSRLRKMGRLWRCRTSWRPPGEEAETPPGEDNPPGEKEEGEMPDTPVKPSLQSLGSGDVTQTDPGTPICEMFSPFGKLPKYDNFGKDMTEHIAFENLPNATGNWDKMRGVLKGV